MQSVNQCSIPFIMDTSLDNTTIQKDNSVYKEQDKKHSIESSGKAIQTPEKTQIAATIVFQKHYRGHLARQKYQIQQENEKLCYNVPCMLIGNDPFFEDEAIEPYAAKNGNIALIGTSCLFAVHLACQLSSPDRAKFIPKIILIDHSIEVSLFWRAIRKFAEKNTNEDDFLKNLEQFLIDHKELIDPISYMDAKYFFLMDFSTCGFNFVRKMIMKTSVIRQGWQDPKTFSSVKNILKHLNIDNIYVYASNIVACTSQMAAKILNNIHLLQPKFSIHSNFVCELKRCDEIFLYSNSEPKKIISMLFPEGLDSFIDKQYKSDGKKMEYKSASK